MALTPSNMLPLQHMAPDFNLLDVMHQENISLTELKGTKGLCTKKRADERDVDE